MKSFFPALRVVRNRCPLKHSASLASFYVAAVALTFVPGANAHPPANADANTAVPRQTIKPYNGMTAVAGAATLFAKDSRMEICFQDVGQGTAGKLWDPEHDTLTLIPGGCLSLPPLGWTRAQASEPFFAHMGDKPSAPIYGDKYLSRPNPQPCLPNFADPLGLSDAEGTNVLVNGKQHVVHVLEKTEAAHPFLICGDDGKPQPSINQNVDESDIVRMIPVNDHLFVLSILDVNHHKGRLRSTFITLPSIPTQVQFGAYALIDDQKILDPTTGLSLYASTLLSSQKNAVAVDLTSTKALEDRYCAVISAVRSIPETDTLTVIDPFAPQFKDQAEISAASTSKDRTQGRSPELPAYCGTRARLIPKKL